MQSCCFWVRLLKDKREGGSEFESEELKWKSSQKTRFVEFNQSSEQRRLRVELRF